MPPTTLASTANILWNTIESYGKDPDPLFRELCIDPHLMRDPNARYPYKKIVALWTRTAELIDDPCLGLKAVQFWHPSYLYALGYAWLASTTLRTALERLARYKRVVTQVLDFRLEQLDDGLSLSMEYQSDVRSLPVQIDFGLAMITSMCRINYGEDLNPVSVSFIHSAPSSSGDYFTFFRCPAQFDAPADRLTLPLDAVDKRLPSSNPQLAQLHDQIMIRYLAQFDKDDIISRTKAAIIDQLPSGSVSDASVAHALYTNVRTFQRQLRKEGTTFKTLMNDIRRELAEQYIRDSTMSLNEISFLLGFSEISSFSRAFKRWTGEPPSAYRRPE
jgi:AraC-like DNA-binding protein